MKEIGSEFCNLDCIESGKKIASYFEGDTATTLLGRDAIGYVLEDMELICPIKRVLFPDYYCESMIKPFRDRNIDVCFYSASFDRNIQIDLDEYPVVDIVFIMQYFGFHQKIDVINKKNELIIEDITHSFFLSNRLYNSNDYMVSSIRKWMPISTGIAIKQSGKFLIEKPSKQHKEYIDTVVKARALKAEYHLSGYAAIKGEYLSLFQKSHVMIENDENNYQCESDVFCCNISHLVGRRRMNAKCLIDALKKLNHEFLCFDELEDGDVPLFVPLRLPAHRRLEVQKHFIKHEIFLPIHWPKDSRFDIINPLYDEEISLVCDQRYTTEDMARMIKVFEEIQ